MGVKALKVPFVISGTLSAKMRSTTPYHKKDSPSLPFVIVTAAEQYKNPTVVYTGDHVTGVFIERLTEDEKDNVSM